MVQNSAGLLETKATFGLGAFPPAPGFSPCFFCSGPHPAKVKLIAEIQKANEVGVRMMTPKRCGKSLNWVRENGLEAKE